VGLGEKVITLGGGISCRKGDRVMVIKNMRAPEDDGGEERYLPNGTTGKCVQVLGDFRGVFEFDGATFTLGGDKLKLTLAYAMTIHKSQGSGWDHVVVIADPAHAYMLRESGRQLMYTAVTRVQKRLTVLGSATTFEDVALGKMSNLRQTYLKQFYPA
jgi:exodeoxyribonuclease V alpha subunit